MSAADERDPRPEVPDDAGPGADGSDPDAGFVLPIGEELDLHAFAPRDVPGVVEDYLDACRERGVLRVRVVHGRGKGVQRAVVQRLLRSLSSVARFSDAPPESGGWGATLVELRPPGT